MRVNHTRRFLRSRFRRRKAGFDRLRHRTSLKPHQIDICRNGHAAAARAVFCRSSDSARRASPPTRPSWYARAGGRFLIIALGVTPEFTLSDGAKKRWDYRQYVRDDTEDSGVDGAHLITNYGRVRDGGITLGRQFRRRISTSRRAAVTGSKTYQSAWGRKVKVPLPVLPRHLARNQVQELIRLPISLGVMDSGRL